MVKVLVASLAPVSYFSIVSFLPTIRATKVKEFLILLDVGNESAYLKEFGRLLTTHAEVIVLPQNSILIYCLENFLD